MSSRLPLFPLGAVLFPGTPLPLHIFEPRYRQLLADCLAGDQRFGIIPTDIEGEAPQVGAVGCIAEIRANQELADGRSNIVVIGASRFVLTRVLDDPTPYQIGLIQPFDDDPTTLPDSSRVSQLRELFIHYVMGLRQLSDIAPTELNLPADAKELSFNVAAAAELDVRVKRRLLAERSTARRIEVLLSLLPALTARMEAALRIHQRSRANGKGGTQPDIVVG